MGRRWHGQDGNTLALIPAAVMVMFVLASMAIDAALTFSAQRQLADIAAAAANDAATALGDSPYVGSAGVAVDPVEADQRVAAAMDRRTDADELQAVCRPEVPADGSRVTVTCTGRVRQLVSPMRLLGVGSRDLRAQATAHPAAG